MQAFKQLEPIPPLYKPREEKVTEPAPTPPTSTKEVPSAIKEMLDTLGKKVESVKPKVAIPGLTDIKMANAKGSYYDEALKFKEMSVPSAQTSSADALKATVSQPPKLDYTPPAVDSTGLTEIGRKMMAENQRRTENGDFGEKAKKQLSTMNGRISSLQNKSVADKVRDGLGGRNLKEFFEQEYQGENSFANKWGPNGGLGWVAGNVADALASTTIGVGATTATGAGQILQGLQTGDGDQTWSGAKNLAIGVGLSGLNALGMGGTVGTKAVLSTLASRLAGFGVVGGGITTLTSNPGEYNTIPDAQPDAQPAAQGEMGDILRQLAAMYSSVPQNNPAPTTYGFNSYANDIYNNTNV